MGTVHVTGCFATCSGWLNGHFIRDLYGALCIGRQLVKSDHVTIFVWSPNLLPCVMSSSYVFMDIKWFACTGDQDKLVALYIFMFCWGGCLAGHCACVSPGEILYILPKLATMSALCSWQVHCLGQVIWWLDRNKQGLLTESVNKCILCVLK